MAVHLHFQEKGILPKLGHQIVVIYDWLSGPPMTEQERVTRALTEMENGKQLGRPTTCVDRESVLRLHSQGLSHRAIATQLGVSHATVGRILRGTKTP